ncbi:hypothetical protein WMY93_000132 [Mugilogobius chulae]|uniref:Uncharacterized protein n=1 Tax=Mugilogobius chulae TaxID=88201 RepID=A0AAW0QDI8_9GOBI
MLSSKWVWSSQLYNKLSVQISLFDTKRKLTERLPYTDCEASLVQDEFLAKCLVHQLQPTECPVYDLDQNVDFIGKYQTITKTGAITVQRKDFPSGSFYVVVVVKIEDVACDGPPFSPDEMLDPENRTKILDVVVSPVVYVLGRGEGSTLDMFLVVGGNRSTRRKPTQTQGEHANST